MEQIRSWLSIQLIDLGIRLCPYPEMQEYLKQGFILAIDSYLEKEEEDDEGK